MLDIQTNLLNDLRTTVVIPLCQSDLTGHAAITRLCPVIKVEGRAYIALTQQIAGIDRKALGNEVGDFSQYRDDIIAALDFMVSGI
ncbi:CcdB family protein [Methylobacillus sp. Pita1]|uniref:CcdB family protein n=1 Tax=Methylobacillus sp. Pita1 TaxID=3382642 RepID=UPI0038B4F032